jgi:AcrR family transcriptional regulator
MIDKKTQLLECARDLFSSNGFKDTNVADITKQAGVATGTFYLYYASKEKLFMDLFLAENTRLKTEILAAVDPNGDPLTVIQELIHKNLQGIAANPILKEWFNKDVFHKIEEKFREENGLDHLDFLYDSFTEIIKKWQTEGKFRSDIPSQMIMALFSAVIVIDQHKDEIGFQYFPQIQTYLTEFVIKGLTDCSNGTH